MRVSISVTVHPIANGMMVNVGARCTDTTGTPGQLIPRIAALSQDVFGKVSLLSAMRGRGAMQSQRATVALTCRLLNLVVSAFCMVRQPTRSFSTLRAYIARRFSAGGTLPVQITNARKLASQTFKHRRITIWFRFTTQRAARLAGIHTRNAKSLQVVFTGTLHMILHTLQIRV